MIEDSPHGSYTRWKWYRCNCTICAKAKAEAIKPKPVPLPTGFRKDFNTAFDPSWREKAECRRFGPLDWKYENGKTRHMTAEEWGAFVDRVFFVQRGGSYEEALTICARCPVKEECLQAGLVDLPTNGQTPTGIWGGKSQRERHSIRGRKWR